MKRIRAGGTQLQFLLFCLNRLFLCNTLRLQWFALWMLPICIASLPPVSGWLSSPPPPSLLSPSLLPPPLSSSSCTHLLELRCRCYRRVSALVSSRGCSLRRRRFCRSVSLGADIRGWGNTCAAGCNSQQVQSHRLLRTTAAFRHRQMRLGFNYGPIPLDMLWNPWRSK